MSNKTLGQEALAELNSASIGEIRALAKFYGVKSERTWKKTDYIDAIVAAQSGGRLSFNVIEKDEDDWKEDLPEVKDYSAPAVKSGVKSDQPAPGFARLLIHKDPTPGHANSPVPLGLNGRTFLVPRGVEVDLPHQYVGILKDAVQVVIRQKSEPTAANPAGEMVEEAMLTYPFQVIAITPGGKFNSAMDQRGQIAIRKQAFADALGKYPASVAELVEFEKEQRADARATKQR